MLRFSDGVNIPTDGPLRAHCASDGWYVVGEGVMSAVADEAAARIMIAAMQAQRAAPVAAAAAAPVAVTADVAAQVAAIVTEIAAARARLKMLIALPQGVRDMTAVLAEKTRIMDLEHKRTALLAPPPPPAPVIIDEDEDEDEDEFDDEDEDEDDEDDADY